MATNAELTRRIAELEAENLRLRGSTVEREAAPGVRRGRSLWRAIVSAVLIVLAGILTPVAAVSAWTSVQLTDTETFVRTLAPLAEDPAVQQVVATQVVGAIESSLDIDELVGSVFDGIEDLGLGTRASAALDLLRGPAAAGTRTLIANVVDAMVASDAFAEVWEQSLRVSHTQLIATMQGDPDALLTVSDGTEIGLQLGPLVERARALLLDNGVGLAEMIPEVDIVVPLATSDALPTAQLGYGVAAAAGLWLPWVVLALFVAGVLVARRRLTATIGAGVALAIGSLALGLGLIIGRAAAGAALATSGITPAALDVAYGNVTEIISRTALFFGLVGALVAIAAWLAGPWRAPRALRGGAGRMTRAAHARLVAFWPGLARVSSRLARWRILARVVVLGVAGAIILFARPLHVGTIVWTVLLAALALWLYELLSSRPVDDEAEAVATGDPVAPPVAG